MFSAPPSLRLRALVSVGAVTTLGLGLAAALPVSSGAAAPAGAPVADCAEAFPVAEVTDGDAVTGLTVTKGTDPTGFTGEIIGVLTDGIAPDVDLILADLTSSEIDRVGGIWSGMSGSPVYAEDGRLIGAVAYGFSFGPSPVAGITPFEHMEEFIDRPAPSTVEVSRAEARQVADRTDVAPAQARQGLVQLPMPLGVTGIGAARLASLPDADFLSKDVYALGRASAAQADADDIVAGGNIASAVAYGDVTLAGVGTATSVCGDTVVGFGHPMLFEGDTSMTMHPASAVYVQEDPTLTPFKMANVAGPVGTITDDRYTGIAGEFGALPETTTITSTVAGRGRERTGTTEVTVPYFNGEATFYQLINNYIRVVDGAGPGSEEQVITITGTDGNGEAFTFSTDDLITSRFSILDSAAFEPAILVEILQGIENVDIDTVTVDGEVTANTARYRITRMQQKQGGQWVPLTKKRKGEVKAGRVLRVRYFLKSATGNRWVEERFRIPKEAAGTRAKLFVSGDFSSDFEDFYYFDFGFGGGELTVEKLIKQIEEAPRSDQATASLFTAGRGGGFGFEEEFLKKAEKVGKGRKCKKNKKTGKKKCKGKKGSKGNKGKRNQNATPTEAEPFEGLELDEVSDPQGQVITGSRRATIRIR